MLRNPLKLDPQRSTMLRRKFVGEMNQKFRKIKGKINQLVVVEDSFGLDQKGITFNEPFHFISDEAKIVNFQRWLQGQVDADILTVGSTGAPWTNPYIGSSYKKGLVRSYVETHSESLAKSSDFYGGSKAEFLREAFGGSVGTKQVGLLYTRAFDALAGVTDTMGHEMSRVLADGLSQGLGSDQVARSLNRQVDGLTKTRARVVARTELARAHAEGQLDGYEKLGVEELGIMAEWSTTLDDRVCPQCGNLEGVVMSVKEARGLIPRHPNCRCAWIPADAKVKEKGQPARSNYETLQR